MRENIGVSRLGGQEAARERRVERTSPARWPRVSAPPARNPCGGWESTPSIASQSASRAAFRWGEAVASQQLHCQGDEDALSGRAVDAIVTPDAACAPRGAAGAERALGASVSRVPSPRSACCAQVRNVWSATPRSVAMCVSERSRHANKANDLGGERWRRVWPGAGHGNTATWAWSAP